jgi:formate dehydrogenase subunit delta
MSHDQKLVYMANQIGKFFASQGAEQAVSGTAEHIKKSQRRRRRAGAERACSVGKTKGR